jgi:hypothetical protein
MICVLATEWKTQETNNGVAQTYAQNAIDVTGFRIRTAASWALRPAKGVSGNEKQNS